MRKNQPDIIEIAGTRVVVGESAAARILNQEIMSRVSSNSRDYIKRKTKNKSDGAAFFDGDAITEDITITDDITVIAERTIKGLVSSGDLVPIDDATRAEWIKQGLYEERPGKPDLFEVNSLFYLPNSWCPQTEQASSCIIFDSKETGYSERTLNEHNAQGGPHFRVGRFVGRNVSSYSAWDFNRKK